MIVEKSGTFISSTQPVCVRTRAFLSRRLHSAVDRDGHIEEDRGSAGLGLMVDPPTLMSPRIRGSRSYGCPPTLVTPKCPRTQDKHDMSNEWPIHAPQVSA